MADSRRFKIGKTKNCVCGADHETVSFPLREPWRDQDDMMSGRYMLGYVSELVAWGKPFSVEQCNTIKDIMAGTIAEANEKLKTAPVRVKDKEASEELKKTLTCDLSKSNDLGVSFGYLRDTCPFLGQLLYHDFCTWEKLELVQRSVFTREQDLLVLYHDEVVEPEEEEELSEDEKWMLRELEE